MNRQRYTRRGMMSAPAPRTTVAALAAALALTVAGCSSKADSGGGGNEDTDGVQTGIGVTAEEISLGALTDMTGPYASLGKSVTQAQQLYFKRLNADGGVCDRQVKLVVRDHGYDAGKAIPAYTELQPKVLGFPQFIGSPLVGAVKERIDSRDKGLVFPLAWSASLLGSEHIRTIGATYDVETMNAVDFLMQEKGLEKGGTIGHVYFEGDYGENALQGTEHAAEQYGLTVVEQKIKPTDEDMSAQVTAFKKAGVDAVMISAGPRQAASLVGVAAAAGLSVPIIGNNSTFAPQLLDTQAGPVLTKNYFVAASILPIGSDEPGPKQVAETYLAEYPEDKLDNGVVAGWNTASLFGEVLKNACENQNLTREGITEALLSMDSYDDRFGGTHDFSDPNAPSTRESFILKPDANTPGGLVVAREGQVAESAQDYTPGQ